ncbi:ATP-grasp domain-containing protein [Streptomyces profundus]|uniref:ATP-grasp domain-containing protein n=1 Tax=Streptomyces profundus TaxID=2867410 RepID=UPI001D16AA28|nr:ATP-grasp domain-containing protein [Streptomyces sp. MA3_2.13]UED88002.1 ATP-grasp domain-containing protein [Streptomyces sp. MA3_2.13]
MHVLMVNSGRVEVIDHLPADADVTVVTEASYTHRYPAGTRIQTVPDIADLTSLRAVALRVDRERRIDRVLASSERSLQGAGYLRSFLALPGTRYDVVNRFSNKLAMKTALRAAGVPLTDFRGIATLEDIHTVATEWGWPLVVKPALGAGAQDTFVLRGSADLDVLVTTERGDGLRGADYPLLVERFVDMTAEYHCDGIVRSGRTDFLAVSSYLSPLLERAERFIGSYVLPPSHPDIEAVRDLHQATVTALGLETGVTHMELFRTAHGLVVSEISCRPAGMGVVDGIALQTGVNLWDAFVAAELGRTPSVVPLTPARDGIVVNCTLPVRPGRITRLSSAASLSEVAEVTRVTMKAGVGDVIGPRLMTTSTTGLVLLEVADERQLRQAVHRLMGRYVLEVEPT